MNARNFYRAVTTLAVLVGGLNIATAASRSRTSDIAPTTSSTVIVIDAGHGGFDRGGIPRQRISEKDMTLDVALRLRSILQKAGYRVVMTRDSDVFVTLGNRIGLANSYRDAVFICIHFNSATRAGANGIETYFYGRDSYALASAIHYNLIGNTSTQNRGVRRRGYYVLRKARVPAVLVECGFLTNPTEGRNALSSGYRQSLAENIARGIRNRSAVASRSSSGQLVAEGAIPLQPFIDQTRVRDRDISRKKRSSKKSRRKSSTTSSDDSGHEIASQRKKSSRTRSED